MVGLSSCSCCTQRRPIWTHFSNAGRSQNSGSSMAESRRSSILCWLQQSQACKRSSHKVMPTSWEIKWTVTIWNFWLSVYSRRAGVLAWFFLLAHLLYSVSQLQSYRRRISMSGFFASRTPEPYAPFNLVNKNMSAHIWGKKWKTCTWWCSQINRTSAERLRFNHTVSENLSELSDLQRMFSRYQNPLS
jgi:hypothetical protein